MKPEIQDKNYDVAIFDFDGTLVDSLLIYPFIHKEVLRQAGVEEQELQYLDFNFWHKEVASIPGHVDIVSYMIERHGLEGILDGVSFRRMRNSIEMEYFSRKAMIPELSTELCDYAIKPVIKDLHRLKRAGAKCFVVSNNYGNIVESALEALDISNMFEDCFCYCAYEDMKHPTYDRNQPKKVSFAEIMQITGVEPSQCVVYDDLLKYVEEATSLGMDAVWVDNEHAYVPQNGGKTC